MSHNLLWQQPALEEWSYPLEVSKMLAARVAWFDTDSSDRSRQALTQPMLALCSALEQWQRYLAQPAESFAQAFLAQARWLVQHEVLIAQGGSQHDGESREQVDLSVGSGWPLPVPGAGAEIICLSAQVQGMGLSVLVRAYQLSGEGQFLDVARRVARSFAEDILDGGVQAPVGESGIFFETLAIYPAAHQLSGFLLAVLGLYEYLRVLPDARLAALLQESLETFHRLLSEFDTGYWIRDDLLTRTLATPVGIAVQSELMETLAELTTCELCKKVARRWQGYRRSRLARSRAASAGQFSKIWRRLQSACFPRPLPASPLKACVIVPAFPVTGGIFTFLKNLVRVTTDSWQYEYLTQHIGPQPSDYRIHRFGTRRMTPWYFPFVWLYVLAGCKKLFSLLRRGAGYTLILAQDGVYTGTLAGLLGRLSGVRVVCIDHSDISLLLPANFQVYRAQRLREISSRGWPWIVRWSAAALAALYWPSRALLARLSARLVDAYLIPGTSQDGVNTLCQQLGISSSRLTRIHNMIELEHHQLPDAQSRHAQRTRYGLTDEARVIALVCRLTTEKGLDSALSALDLALARLTEDQRAQVSMVFVGDGPLRSQLEADVRQRGLDAHCQFLGDASREKVSEILGISDIFLYTSIRGAGYPFAILEAMASSCAVIASTEPPGNQELLAEGRGMIVPVGDAEQTANALVRLLTSPLQTRQMGELARAYVEKEHSPARFQRALLRAMHWRGLRELLAQHSERGRAR